MDEPQMLGGVLAHARFYDGEQESDSQFKEFVAWSNERLPGCCSAWRTRVREGWCIVVVDESEAFHSLDFPWAGTGSNLSQEQALAFIQRRNDAAQAIAIEGRTEFRILNHYAKGEGQPVLRNGRWTYE